MFDETPEYYVYFWRGSESTFGIGIITTLVFSYVRYCAQVYAGTNRTVLFKLQKVFNFAARVISGRIKFDHISDVLQQLGWLNVEQFFYA